MIAKKRLLAAVLGGLLFAGASSLATAGTITYSTDGVFTGNVDSISGGGITITYNDMVDNSVSLGEPPAYAPVTTASLGYFQVSGTLTGDNTFSTNFVLTVDQSVPSAGSGQFGQATVSGTISYNSSGGTITFNTPLSVTIDGGGYAVEYQLIDLHGNPLPPDNELSLVPPSTNSGITTVESLISETTFSPTVPLPASVLSGSALLGGIFLAKAFKRKNTI